MKNLLFIVIVLLPFILNAQINDDFEDGNLDGWTESTAGHFAASSENPINGTYSLHHVFDNTATGHDQISIPFGAFDISAETTTWRFQTRYEYNPSGDNTWSVFLFADNNASEMFPGGNINGYVFGVNFSGTSDLVKLWKITNGSASQIVNTNYNWQTNIGTSGTAGFEIKRTVAGDWSIFIDDNGGFDNLIQIGTTTNNTDFNTTNYFGICYEYTSTADQNLWLDDFYLGSEIADTEAPEIQNIEAISNNTILVNFNENLLEATAENVSNYSVDGGIANPTSATLNISDNKQVELVFSGTFINDNEYTLTANNVEDLSGNATSNETGTYTYTQIDAINVYIISATELDVVFNKIVDITSAQTTLNYSVNNGIGNPASATVDGTDNKLVHLTFASNFQLEQSYTITINNVEDLIGNIMNTANLDFFFYEVQAYDLVINEIMCDVNPVPEALPVHEYVEIYNNSDYDINLSGWTFKIGDNTPKNLPNKTIPAGEYGIICEDLAEAEFNSYGITLGIMNPSELTTTGKRLVIRNENNNIIEDLTYSIDWYNDTDKDGGGWSIERIDPLNFCGENENWTATVDYTGGTPGRLNSVYATNPDNSAPEISSINLISSKHLQITFSEKVEQSIAETITNYTLNGTINPTSALISSESTAVVNIYFADNFNIGNNTILIQNIEDNCSNVLNDYSGNFDYQLIYPLSIEIMSENQLRIHFSEKVELNSAQEQVNYLVNNGIGNPAVAVISNADSTIVNLQFANSFTLEQAYTITIENVKDINANNMNTANIDFIYYVAKPFDIVINEIMCDVNPAPLTLPAEKYVELYNTSSFDLDLTDWYFLSEGQSERVFPYLTLRSHEFLILCEEGNENLFAPYGNVVGFLTSSDIIASGRNLKLYSSDNTIIEEITYSDDWYGNDDKDNGGWSLERIDPTNFCGEQANWKACNNSYGGSPGTENSVFAPNQDNIAPDLINVDIISSNFIKLTFNENISYLSGNDTLNYSINNGINNPHEASVETEDRKIVYLKFSSQFADGQENTLTLENLKDNCGNSMITTEIDFTYHSLHPVELWVKDEKRLKIKFSETVDLTSGTTLTNYTGDNSVGNPFYVARETTDTTIVYLEFENNFPDGEDITLTISGVKDINGNTMETTDLIFSYYTPKKDDIAINEILFYPNSGGSEFVELYNKSDKKIDLINIQIATWDEKKDTIKSLTPLSKTNKYFEPETYLAFTKSKEGVLTYYMSKNHENIIELQSFPSFNNDAGKVLLMYKDTSRIDEFNYYKGMHFQLLDNKGKGVSLERVNYNKPTEEVSNWHSASEYVGFATPAYKNSQYSENVNSKDKPITIEPYMFSPDNDGFEDYANINYKFEKPGYVATVIVFDAKGRKVKQIANNYLLAVEGTLSWDGLYENGKLAPAGTYLILFNVFDTEGNTKAYKLPVVSAVRF